MSKTSPATQKKHLEKVFYTFIPHCVMKRSHKWSADKHKRLEQNQVVEDLGDAGYGVGSISIWKGDHDR